MGSHLEEMRSRRLGKHLARKSEYDCSSNKPVVGTRLGITEPKFAHLVKKAQTFHKTRQFTVLFVDTWTLVPTMNNVNPVDTLLQYFSNTHFNTFLPITLTSLIMTVSLLILRPQFCMHFAPATHVARIIYNNLLIPNNTH
jgi:hypothetical protein